MWGIVALRKESVDRNSRSGDFCFSWLVALRKESVDRNSCWGTAVIAFLSVALRKESADRNTIGVYILIMERGSLSARRAWIEIGLSIWRK